MTVPAPTLKLCKDCIFSKVGWIDYIFAGGYKFAKCTFEEKPVIGHYTPVTGRAYDHQYHFCATEREYFGNCGQEARNFEPRK